MTTSFFLLCLLCLGAVLSVPIKRAILEHHKFRRGEEKDVSEGNFIIKLKEDSEADPRFPEHRDWLNHILSPEEQGKKIHNLSFRKWKGYTGSFDDETIAQILERTDVAYVEQDHIVRISNTQANAPVPLDMLDGTEDGVYDYPLDGNGVVVFVLDTGVLANPYHADFDSSGVRVNGLSNYVNDNLPDCNGHGTHINGIIGGIQSGVAKGVRIHNVKVLDCNGEGTVGNLIAALGLVVQTIQQQSLDKVVINLSLTTQQDHGISDALEQAIDAGAWVVAAAGNEGLNACGFSPGGNGDPSDPAYQKHEKIITVGASMYDDSRASYSNTGACVDIYAPGSSIVSADIIPQMLTYNTYYGQRTGTSQSAAYVSGVAALYLQHYGANADIKSLLLSTGVVVGFGGVRLRAVYNTVVAGCDEYPGNVQNPSPYTLPYSPVSSTPVTGICIAGFQPSASGGPRVECRDSGWFFLGGGCDIIRCPATSGSYVSFDATDAGTDAEGTCLSGSFSAGGVSRPCDLNGAWGDVVGSCEPILDCPAGDATGFHSSWSATTPGFTVEGICDKDYIVYAEGATPVDREEDFPQRTCGADGIWQDPNTPCVPIEPCQGGNHVQTHTYLIEKAAGTEYIPECMSGYKPDLNAQNAMCTESGVWEIYYDCVPQMCEQKIDLEGSGGASFDAIAYGETRDGVCPTGKVPALGDAPQAECLADGDGDGDGDWNLLVGCVELSPCAAGEAGNAFYDLTHPGDVATGTCLPTFETTETLTRSCSSSGEWSTPTFTCTPILCPERIGGTEEYGFGRFLSANADSTAFGDCVHAAYLAGGRPTLECMANGEWNMTSLAGSPCTAPVPLGCPGGINHHMNSVWEWAPARAKNVYGTCLEGYTSPEGRPRRNCRSDGTWAIDKKSSRCK